MGKHWRHWQCGYIEPNGKREIKGWNLAACQENCSKNSKCTAIEFREDGADTSCYLRTCKLPPPELEGSGAHSAYYLGPGRLYIRSII